jgi:hypothetical protein
MMMGTWILLQLGARRLQIQKDEDFLQKGFDPIGFPGLMNVVLVGCNGGEGDEKYSGGEDIDNGYQEFEVENSESPLREERLIQPVFGSSILGMHSRECIPTRMHSQECIF